jgi:ABC-type dipeptide/oligopeptide/nickel transport system permease component
MPERIVLRHALRNALIPVVTVLGIQLGFLLAGAVLVENVFAWPGVGRQLITALNAFDYPTIQGIVLLSGAFFLLVNMLTEVLYVVIDPRIRLQ